MKGFLDTSVLVPVFYGSHIHHEASLNRFIQFDRSTGCCGAHSLAEVYSTLTGMPGKHRISGEQTMLFVGSIRERLSIILSPAMNTPMRSRPFLTSGLSLVEFMTPWSRLVPSRHRPKPFIPGTAGATRFACRK